MRLDLALQLTFALTSFRLMIMPKDQRDRRMIYKYLMMAIHPADDDSPQTLLTEIASNAHAILIRWCTEALAGALRASTAHRSRSHDSVAFRGIRMIAAGR